MLGICPNCEKETSLVLVKEPEEFDIRGEIIVVDNEYYKCEVCGEEFEDLLSDYDPLETAYSKYREMKGLLKPEEIKRFRKRMGLTQSEFSKLAGIGIATLNRYENGALQSESHDKILKLYMDVNNLLKSIEQDKSILGDLKKEKIREIIKPTYQYELFLNLIKHITSYNEANIYNGFLEFNFDKFQNAFKHFCYGDKVFKTKLTKLFFYADFEHFRQYSNSITGSCYAHLPHGPVPDNFETLFGLLLERDESIVLEETWINDCPGELYYSESSPDYSLFSNSELKILTTVKEKFSGCKASEIKDFSHREIAYQETKNGQLIPFIYAKDLQEL